MGNVDPLSFGSHSEHLTQVFNVIIRVISMSFVMQNSRRLSIFGCVLKHEAVTGAYHFSFWFCYILHTGSECDCYVYMRC